MLLREVLAIVLFSFTRWESLANVVTEARLRAATPVTITTPPSAFSSPGELEGFSQPCIALHCFFLTRQPFDRLIVEFRRRKGSSSSKKVRRSKRSILGTKFGISQKYSSRKVNLELPYHRPQRVYIKKQRNAEENIFKNKTVHMVAKRRTRRSFARHRNILRGRGGGRSQQFRLI